MFGIYNEKGKFSGELRGYEDIARDIDIANTLYHVKTLNREIIIGSRITVSKGEGREERAIFICKQNAESLNFVGLTSDFFKLAVNELKKEGYDILGCWEEGDLNQLMKIEDNLDNFHNNLYKAVVGMVVSGKKALIKSSNPIEGVILIAKTIQALKTVLNLDFNFEVSKIHSSFDISITPTPLEYDVNLDNQIVENKWNFLDFYDAYESIKGYNFESRKELKEKIGAIKWDKELKGGLKLEKSVINFYDEKPEKFLKEIANMQDPSRIINEIGLHSSYVHPKISDDVAAEIIKKSIDMVDENGERFLEKLYDGLDQKGKIIADLLHHIVDKIEDRSLNFKKRILNDVIKCGNGEVFRKAINRDPLFTAEVANFDDAVKIIKHNLDEYDKLNNNAKLFIEKLYEKVRSSDTHLRELHQNLEYDKIMPKLHFMIANDALRLKTSMGYVHDEKKTVSKPILQEEVTKRKYESAIRHQEEEFKKKKKKRRSVSVGISVILVVIAVLAIALFSPSPHQVTDYLGLTSPRGATPVIILNVSDDNPVVNQNITFNASSSYKPDGTILTYEWDFGDGTSGIGKVVNRSYSSGGSYMVNLTVIGDDRETKITSKMIIVTLDTMPPSSITNLLNITGQTWINWTWNKPPDADFNYTMVYLNGTWKENRTPLFYNETELNPDARYEISTHTVDKAGNVNATWVNQTAKTKA